MKVLFIDFFTNIYDKHPIYSISSVLKKNGHEVSYLVASDFDKSIESVLAIKPELILYSCFSSEVYLAVQFDALMKNQYQCHSLIGGPGPTFDDHEIQSSTIDAICVGEGEIAIVDYISSQFQPNSNIYHRSQKKSGKYYPMAPLDELPFPDRSVIYEQDHFLRDMPTKQFMAGRGCPYHCTYCHNDAFLTEFKDSGPKFRYKSVDYLIAEIKEVREKYPLENIVFQDDVFILDKKWLKEFCEKFPAQVGITFTCNIRANLINDEIIALLKESGCVGVSWSIESGNDFLRNKILRRNMSKNIIRNAASILNKHQIKHRTGNILGIPGETWEQMIETLELNIEIKPYLAMAYTFVPFPGLALTEYAIANNHLDADLMEFIPRTFFKKSVLKFDEETKDKIARLSLIFPALVKFPFLYHQKPIFEYLFQSPFPVVKMIYHMTNIFYSSKMFKVKYSNKQKIKGFLRYLKSGM